MDFTEVLDHTKYLLLRIGINVAYYYNLQVLQQIISTGSQGIYVQKVTSGKLKLSNFLNWRF